MKVEKNLVVALFASLFLVGCQNFQAPGFPLGKMEFLSGPAKNAPPEYTQGWNDGCETGISAYGEVTHKLFSNFKQDINMMSNPIYEKAWTDAMTYCRAYVNRIQLEGLWWSEGFGQRSEGVFDSGQLRNVPDITKDNGFGFSIFDGIQTPGWGDMTWKDTDLAGDD